MKQEQIMHCKKHMAPLYSIYAKGILPIKDERIIEKDYL